MKKLTNVQLVKKMMEFSNYGAMSQMFIMDAISKHAEAVAKLDPDELEKQGGAWTFVSPHAWVGVAQEIKATLDDAYRN